MRLFDWLDKITQEVTAVDTGIISPEQARRELGIDDPYMDWATRSEYQWRERAKEMQTKDMCLWCTTPYEDDSGSCTKCGAPKDVCESILHYEKGEPFPTGWKKPRFSNVTWRI